MNGQFKRNLLVSFGVSLLILIISSTASFLSIKSLLDSNEMVNHTQEVIYNLNEGGSTMVDAQTSLRGYLITGNEESLDRYRGAEERTDGFFDKVESLTQDNPQQQQNIKELKPFREQFFRYLDKRVSDKRKGYPVVAEDLNTGKVLMNNMRRIWKRMENIEQGLLNERISNSQRYGLYSSALIVIAALLSLAISGLFFVRILRDYNERAKLHSRLQESEQETADRIRVISNVAAQISAGNYATRVDDTESDALGTVAVSLNNMAVALEEAFRDLSDKEWHQSGIAGLNNVMIGEKNVEELGEDILDFVAKYTTSQAAVLYALEGDALQIVSGYSYKPVRSREFIKLGEGLTGQAAAIGKMLELKLPAEEAITISYALGEAKPVHVVALPLSDGVTTGVIEIASLREYCPREIAFLKEVSNNIAVALRAAQNRKRIQELLEETQAQSEELRAQHSELESINAELETQTEKLQASEEELRVQQEELQQTNEELAERSVLLEERNVEIQKKSEDLELSTRYKSEFLANMSHELRTPLNSILLLSRLLAENNDQNMNDEQVEFARVIQSSGNGLLGLIDEILDLSKIEAGKMDLEFQEVATSEITGGMKNLFGEMAREKGIELKIEDKNAPLVIKTDKMRLEQILKNLLSNAVKFTSEGAVTLEIEKSGDQGQQVLFKVKDTGIGIPPDKQPLIFEAFQQADGSTKRKYGGTGLGLSISRELAKLLGGEITLWSRLGEGSEFTLSLPIIGAASALPSAAGEETSAITVQLSPMAEPELKENAEQRTKYLSRVIPEAVPDDRESIYPGDRTILIVEDDTPFAKTLLDYTRKRGYKGIVSVRGDQAMNLALSYKPIGVLLDIELPMKSGWEVMEELKANALTRHIPVHIMSSHKVKRESLMKGAINFLDKPAAYEQIPEVFRRIEHIISKESQQVLIIEDNPKHAKALAYFLETNNINSEIKSEVKDGVAALQSKDVDCVILDMGIPDKQAYDILENVKKNPGLENLPVIVFTGKSLSMKEELKLKKYADSIVIKTAHSYQRMLDEVSLFLHLVEESKKTEKPKKLNLLNNILHEKSILVVDDDVRNIYSLTKALESLKVNVLTAMDGNEALRMLDENPTIDVVLLDMMMPNMDGYETATRIRQNKRFKNLPVIAVTAKAMTGDREKCINAGASDYITKPVDVDQLLSLLRVWLYDRQ